MFEKLEAKYLPLISAYIEQFNDDVIYLMKPLEQLAAGNPQGVFYGYIENAKLEGIFYFSNKSVMTLHCTNEKILRNLHLLKAIKFHKPKFVKGTQTMVDGVYKLMCRAVNSTTESKSTLMKFVKPESTFSNIPESPRFADGELQNVQLITGENKIVDELLSDLRFFIDVETHFGRQVKAINDIVKEFKQLIRQENYMLIIAGKEIVAQGLIEDETEQTGLLSGIYVTPKFRKKGLGEMITKALTDKLTKRGKIPYLFVKNNNANARKLYEKMGYKTVKQYSMMTIDY